MRRGVFVRVFLTFWIAFVISVVIANMVLRKPEQVPFAWALGSRLLIFVLISAAVSLLTTWGITRPIGWLRTAVARVGEGKFSTRVLESASHSKAPLELGELMAEFDKMADQIETLVGSQRQLLADVSHELRSPLSRMSLSIELLRRAPQDNEEHLARLEKEIGKLNVLIQKLLMLSQLEASTLPLEKECFDLADLCAEVVTDIDVEAAARGTAIACVRMDECFVLGDYELLRSAAENVLRNAVQYSEQGSSIFVRVECSKDHSGLLCIENQGPTMSDEELARICQPFYRGNQARLLRPDGHGLGLAIASRAVAMHEGSITARNTGIGLEVQIKLPGFESHG